MFNDILGTSLGVVKDGGYSAIDKTSFGADSTDKSSFFTGKPYVEDLGYAFLFRNYRADLGTNRTSLIDSNLRDFFPVVMQSLTISLF